MTELTPDTAPCHAWDCTDPAHTPLGRAEAERDWWANALTQVNAERDAALARAEKAERERDLAVAHDQQPYPTPWAYQQACEALGTQRVRAEKAEAEIDRLRIQLANADEIIATQLAELKTHRAATGEHETQYAARVDGRDYHVTEWQATDAAKWAPRYQLVSRPVIAIGDWEPADAPTALTALTPGCDEVPRGVALSATHAAPQGAAVHRDGSNGRGTHSDAQEAAT